MTKLESAVLKLLSENARYTTYQLSAMTGESEQAVITAMKNLENSGVIVKYATIINSEMLEEESVQALIEVKIAPQKLHGFDAIAEGIYNFPEVKNLYLMSGGYDLAIFVEGKGLKSLASFVSEKLSTIEGVLSVATHFILKRYKIEGQLTQKEKCAKREIFNA